MTPPGAPFLLPYLVPLMLVTFGSTLVLRFASALRSAEALNRELEARVDEKHRELDRSYEARRALEREKLLAEERERLVREMHDGLGGQLVSLLSLLSLVEANRGGPARGRRRARGARRHAPRDRLARPRAPHARRSIVFPRTRT